jgi:hypothetical protein
LETLLQVLTRLALQTGSLLVERLSQTYSAGITDQLQLYILVDLISHFWVLCLEREASLAFLLCGLSSLFAYHPDE